MPSKEERIFFQRAFRIIDRERRTHWYDLYNFSRSQSGCGRIDWGQIPGLISEHYNGFGYVKAVTRVTEILLEIIESNPNDRKLLKKVRPLALLAKSIYENRRDELETHEEKGISNPGDVAACDAWRDASDVFEEILLVHSPSFINIASKALVIVAMVIGAFFSVQYLLAQFIDTN